MFADVHSASAGWQTRHYGPLWLLMEYKGPSCSHWCTVFCLNPHASALLVLCAVPFCEMLILPRWMLSIATPRASQLCAFIIPLQEGMWCLGKCVLTKPGSHNLSGTHTLELTPGSKVLECLGEIQNRQRSIGAALKCRQVTRQVLARLMRVVKGPSLFHALQ